MTGEQLTVMFKNNPKLTAHALGETLRDFGYRDLKDSYVLEETQLLLDGSEPRGIIGRFIQGWLKDGLN